MRIADTILAQLGDSEFCAMTGAKNFVFLDAGLAFHLPANAATNGINLVEIVRDFELEFDAFYTVQFTTRRGFVDQPRSRYAGVHGDELQELFTAETGLNTHH